MNKVLGLIIMFLVSLCPSALQGQNAKRLKIISYNIWNGFEKDTTRRALFVDWTKGQSADIVVLTELVDFKEKDLVTLGQVCGYPHTALLKEEGYPVGVFSKQPISIISKQLEGFWHGMMHVQTQGIDVIATHLSPFEWKYRLKEANRIVSYIKEKGLKDYFVAGDLNAHSPLDADEIAGHDMLLKNMQGWDASQREYRNLRNGRFDFSVISTFLAAGMEDAIGRLVHPASARMSFPSAYLYNWKIEDKRLPLLRERLDYILLSPSLMERCILAEVSPVEGVSDHYPVSVTLK
jgi:exodeoxyribonuclease-3